MPAYKRPDRKLKPWCYRFWLNKAPYRKCGFRLQKEALAAEADERRRLRRLSTGTAFLTAVNRRLDHLQAYATPGHYRANLSMLRRFSAWRDLLLPEILPQMVRDRLMELAQDLGHANANRHLRALKAVFQFAVNDDLLPRNPCRGIPFFPVRRAVKFVPSPDQLAAVLLRALPLDQAYLRLLLDTGARVRELNNLTWEDVDWQISLVNGLLHAGAPSPRHGQMPAPVSGISGPDPPQGQVRLWTRKKKGGHLTPRWVALSPRGRLALLYAWEHRDKKSPHVFINPRTGRAYDYRDKFFDTLCRRAGVHEMGFHALRHYYASNLAQAGRSLAQIQKLLGHENAVTTAHYLHSMGIEK